MKNIVFTRPDPTFVIIFSIINSIWTVYNFITGAYLLAIIGTIIVTAGLTVVGTAFLVLNKVEKELKEMNILTVEK